MNTLENETQKTFTTRYGSIYFTILVTIVFFLLLGVVSIATGIIFADDLRQFRREGYCWANGLAQLILSIMVMLLMQKLGIFDRREYAGNPIGKGLFVGLVGMVYALFTFIVNFAGNFAYAQIPDLTYFLSNIFVAFTTGLFEETLVRGFAYNNFRRHWGNSLEDVKKSILWSSVLFGVMHIFNLGGFDLASVLTVLAQVIYASILGMYFALVYTKSKSMWTVVIIHAMIDGATFVLNSLLSPEAFQTTGGEVSGVGQTVILSFVLPLIVTLPFVIAVIIKWKKLRVD